MSVNYIVISPVRNEGANLPRTIASMVSQSVSPQLWVIVNDGSTDDTGRIAAEAAGKHSWIRVIHRPDRGFRKSGVGVMDAFYDGYALLNEQPANAPLPLRSGVRGAEAPPLSTFNSQPSTLPWEFLVKLDGDLEFGPEFFQEIFAAFHQDPTLGISGGDIYHPENGELVIESRNDPAFHVRGATKVYRRACWDAIGGLVPATGWDTLDEVKANMLNWRTGRVPSARVLHLRPTGGADGGWRNAFKNGRGSYISGYHPLFMIFKCLKRLLGRPVLIHSLGLFTGFFTSYFSSVQQIPDRDLIRYLRKQQLRRLVGLPSIWR